jgi:hypothetical protein
MLQRGRKRDRATRSAGPERKGAVRINERPKSREETPKEGYDTQAKLAMSHRKSTGALHNFQMQFLQSCTDENEGLDGKE